MLVVYIILLYYGYTNQLPHLMSFLQSLPWQLNEKNSLDEIIRFE